MPRVKAYDSTSFSELSFRNYENYRHQNRQGFLADDLWAGYLANLRDQLRAEYVRDWWTKNNLIFGANFREWVDEEMRTIETGRTAFDPSAYGTSDRKDV